MTIADQHPPMPSAAQPEQTIAIPFVSDDVLIEQGKAIVQTRDRLQLRLGKLALRFAPMGEHGQRSGSYRRVDLYADCIGADGGTLRNYRAVAHAWSVVDIGEDEFSYAILKFLAPVGNKEEAVRILREERRPDAPDKPWTAETIQAVCVQRDLMGKPGRKKGVGPGTGARGTSTARGSRRRSEAFQRGVRREARTQARQDDVATVLRGLADEMASLSVVPADREVLDPALAAVESEVARLRRELTGS